MILGFSSAAAAALPAAPRTAMRRNPKRYRAYRGGDWNNDASNCRSANRNWNDPSNTNNNLGFRLASAPTRNTSTVVSHHLSLEPARIPPQPHGWANPKHHQPLVAPHEAAASGEDCWWCAWGITAH